MDNKKKYILTSITLGIIAASSGALIGLSNLATKNRIAQNEIDKVNKGIQSIFGKESSIKEESAINGFQYVNYEYTVKDNNDASIGYAYRTSGKNMYGKISLLVGFDYTSLEFIKVFVITDEQTYASTLEDEYISPLNGGSRDLDDTSCGATFGAKLVKEMVDEASKAVKERNNG